MNSLVEMMRVENPFERDKDATTFKASWFPGVAVMKPRSPFVNIGAEGDPAYAVTSFTTTRQALENLPKDALSIAATQSLQSMIAQFTERMIQAKGAVDLMGSVSSQAFTSKTLKDSLELIERQEEERKKAETAARYADNETFGLF